MATLDRESPLCLGREAELARLQDGLDAAVAGRGGLIVLSGDPGIGKSRLAETAAAAALRAGAGVVWGRCWEAGGAPAYWPWTEALRALAAERGPDALAALAPGPAREAGRLVPELGVPEQRDEASDAARFALFDGVAELLLAAARERPLLVVLEDLHAADPTSLLLLDLLVPRLATAPLLVLSTQRSGDPSTHPAAEALLARLGRRGQTYSLRGLSPAATRALATAGAGRELSDEAAAALQQRSEGNPFFVLSLARLLDESHEQSSPLPLPAGVRDTMARRFETLSEGSRVALAAASVLGRDFALPRLAELRGIEPADALALVTPAVRAGLVTEGAAPGELRFSHALIRDWLYGELDPRERAELHRREADSIETMAGRDGRLLDELAHHRIGAVAVGGAAAALDACRRAARHALDGLAFEDAAALYERALALADRYPEVVAALPHTELLLALGDARQRAGDSDGSREAYVRAANLARSEELPEQLARAALGFGAHVVVPGETDDTLVALLEQALELAPESGEVLRAKLLGRLARELHFSADTERPRRLAEQAVALAEASGDPATQAFALGAWHVAHDVPEMVTEREEVARQIVGLARVSGARDLELGGTVLNAVDQLELGRPDAAAALLDEAEPLAQSLRQPALTWRVLLVRGTLALLAGRFDEAERVIDDAHMLGKRARGRAAFRYWILQRNELLFLRGGYGEHEEDVRLLARESPTVWGFGLTHMLAVTGRLDEAHQRFERLVAEDFGGPIDDHAALPVAARCADVCCVLDDPVRAALLYERLLPHADRWIVAAGGLCTGTVNLKLGALANTMRDHARAVPHLEAAASAHRKAGAAPNTALTELELADSLRALGQHERADQLIGHARRTGAALGMRPLLERIESIPKAAQGTPRTEALLGREGDVWLVGFAGSEARLRDRKGLGYLARLLHRPHLEISALELAGGEAVPVAGGDAGELLDEQAKRAYRRRVDELREEVDEAERFNDPERAERASGELEQLAGELSRAVGLGGRDRRAASNAERARVSVTRAIRSAIDAVAEQHDALGRHLDASVRTGSHCRYAPAVGDEVSWRIR